MKKYIYLFSIITVIISCKSINRNTITKMTVIPSSEINKTQQNKAYKLGKRVLMTCNTSQFKPFNKTEVTESVMKNTTKERLTKTCLKFRQWYGTFIDLELYGVYKNHNETIYRYRALYTKKVANKELRVFVNEDNLISAIKSLDWDDNFKNNLK